MIHELLKLTNAYASARANSIRTVMATVVFLEGSSYRRPGVRMLITEQDEMIGAVSGGCVEKEILRQAQSVFVDGKSKIMIYDGRYRLGCEGILYILIEKFEPNGSFIDAFHNTLMERVGLEIECFYSKVPGDNLGVGSKIKIKNEYFSFSESKLDETLEVFKQELSPRFQLIIVGTEHDAVQLCYIASLLGWQVTVVGAVDDPRTEANFPGADRVVHMLPEDGHLLPLDEQTAVILMTHSFVNDLKYLISLKNTSPIYLGLLGPLKRRNKLINDFLEITNDFNEGLLDVTFGPSGINIGAETPQEIAVSIISEILAVIRGHEPMSLKDKLGSIHSQNNHYNAK